MHAIMHSCTHCVEKLRNFITWWPCNSSRIASFQPSIFSLLSWERIDSTSKNICISYSRETFSFSKALVFALFSSSLISFEVFFHTMKHGILLSPVRLLYLQYLHAFNLPYVTSSILSCLFISFSTRSHMFTNSFSSLASLCLFLQFYFEPLLYFVHFPLI